jgi:hypothetical protein
LTIVLGDDTLFFMSARHFTYTVPSSIEGEPEEVVALAIQQVKSLAAVVAQLSTDTFVQLRAAGIDPEAEGAVKAWLDSEDGARARDLVYSAQHFVQAAQAL